MNEIKAYIRPVLGHSVIAALKAAGATNLTTTHVNGFGLFEDPLTESFDAEVVEKRSDMLKLEMICPHAEMRRFVETIIQHARTGKPGDGAIYVLPVLHAVRIACGAEDLV